MEYLNKTDFLYKHTIENFQVYLYTAISFFLPFLMSHPQLLVGSAVNTMLILGAQNIKGRKLWPLIILPSLGALTHGLLFGPFTVFLLYFIPVIWLSNAILVYGYKYFRSKNSNFLVSIVPSIVLKVGVLTIWAVLIVSFNIVPNMFIYAMSVVQLMTAGIGAVIAYGLTKTVVKRFSN